MLRTAYLGAFAFAVLFVALPTNAKQVIGQTNATLAWSASSGPVFQYAVFESRNGAAYSSTPDQIVSSTTAMVQGQPGTTVRIRVAALDAQGQQGPLSPISEAVQFLAAPPPPGGGGGSSGGGDSGGGGSSGGGDSGGGGGDSGDGGGDSGDGGSTPNPPINTNQELGSVDMDGNGSADLLFFEPNSGELIVSLMDRGRQIGTKTIGRQDDDRLVPIEVADFDGDGQADVLWHDAEFRRSEVWKLRGTGASVQALPRRGPSWHIAGCADLNDDDVTDILWSSEGGANSLWQLTRQATVGQTKTIDRAPAGSQLAGTGDLDGDGHTDLIWRNGGAIEWWKMNLDQPTAIVTLPSVNAADRISSVADLDADGRDDLVWSMDRRVKKKARRRGRRVVHYVVVWFSNGMQAPESSVAASSYSAYRIGGLSDVDGNGVGDLAIQVGGKTWGAEIERRKISVRTKKKRKRKRRHVTRWATQWKAADGGAAPEWQVLAP